MLWMGIWVQPYAVIRVQVGVSFRKNGVWPSLYDVVVSLLRLQTPIDCIPHPYWIYTKCFCTLRCCGWAYECTLMLYHNMCRWGGILGKMGYGRACMDVAVSWLRLQTPLDCIPHPYWMYTKCFSTMRCCGWAYGSTLMPYHYMCRRGWVLGKVGYGRAGMMLQCHGWGFKPPLTASHIHSLVFSLVYHYTATEGSVRSRFPPKNHWTILWSLLTCLVFVFVKPRKRTHVREGVVLVWSI